MRLICPHCMSGVTVPDDTAGKEAVCPNCGKSFPTPPRYDPSVAAGAAVTGGVSEAARTSPHPEPVSPMAPLPHSAPPAPPGLVPPAPPVAGSGFLPPAPASAEVPAPAGYTKAHGITLSPRVIAWLPAVLLLLTIVFTCFPWVGSYAGGSAVYSQRPWNAAFGSVSRNFALERAVAIPAGWLDKVRSDWELMVPYLLILILVTGLAWADRGLHAFDPRNIPPLAKVWPHRQTVIFGLAGFVFVLGLFQVSNGFGMERAIRKQVAEQFTPAREAAANSPADQAALDFAVEQTYAKYNLEHTTWMYLALLCNLLAVLAVIGRLILDRRGNKPPPKILLHY
jgi:hypothetical protein